MAENVGDDDSEFDSVTSSQKSFLKSCPFAFPESDPRASPTKSPGGGLVETDSDSTEILGNPISPPVVRTPVLSFSIPTSHGSINDDDVFRTPPENAPLSSAADSEPRARASEMKLRGNSKLKSPTTPVSSASPSLTAENVRVLERNRLSDSVPISSPPSVAAGNVRVSGKNSDLDSPTPPSVAAGDVNLPRKHFDFDSPSRIAIGRTRVLENQPISDAMANTGAPKSSSQGKNLNLSSSSSPIATEGIKITVTENHGGKETDVPFKEIIQALLRNNGENLDERDEKLSYVHILKQCGLKFP